MASPEEDVKYDTAAFGFFMLTGLFMYIVPSAIYTTRTKAEAELRQKVATKKKSLRNTMTGCFLVNFIVLVVACIAAIFLINALQSAEIKSYDPFAVLELAPGASPREIKSAYRKLSLLYHPDKNPGDAEAAEKFMEVSKAHETLTDETSRENFEKYGNPDGPQAQRVSIGLPTFLLDKDKSAFVIFFYLMGFVAIAVAVYWYKRNSDKYGKNLMHMTEQKFMALVMTGLKPSRHPEDIYPVAAEFTSGLPPRRGHESLSSLEAKLKKKGLLPPTSLPDVFLKDCASTYTSARVALFSYMNRLDTSLAPDTLLMLDDLDRIVKFMMRLCGTNIYRDSPAEKRWPPAAKIIEFYQNIVQAIPDYTAGMMQLPHYDPELRKFGNARGRTLKKMNFRTFINMSEEQQRRLLEDLTPEQQEEVLTVARHVPHATMEVTIGIKESKKSTKVKEAELHAGKDVVTIGVKLFRSYGDAELKAPPTVHAPFFPEEKKENWWVLVLLKPMKLKKTKLAIKEAQLRTVYVGRITKQELVVEASNVQFMAPPVPGKYEITTRLKCDSYSGVDIEDTRTVTFIAPEADTSGHGHSHGGAPCHGHGSPMGSPVSGGGSRSNTGLTESQMRKRAARERKKQLERARRAEVERAAAAVAASLAKDAEAEAGGDGDGAANGEDPTATPREESDVESEDDDMAEMLALAYEHASSSEEEEEMGVGYEQQVVDDGGLAEVFN